jgi:hypothetical protein
MHSVAIEVWANHWCGQHKPDTAAKTAKVATKAAKKEAYGKFVKMTPDEYDKLVAEFGHKRINEMIQRMDAWCNKPGNKYTDFNLAIRDWLRRDQAAVPQGPIY